MSNEIATIIELCIYPIKSMAGVTVQQAEVGFDGILGDRQYSFVRSEHASKNSFPWMTARDSGSMLLYKPEFSQLPTQDQTEPALTVRTPDGTVHEAPDPRLSESVASKREHPVFLLKSARGLFDCQHISIFSLASVEGLSKEAGVAIDRRQFRANIYVEPASGRAFDEETWTNCLLQIGEEVLVGVTQRDTRCMMVNLNPDTGEQNPAVLRTITQSHQRQAGLYANVVRPGTIRVNDSIRMVSKL